MAELASRVEAATRQWPTALANLSPLARLAWRDLRGAGRYLWTCWLCVALGVALVAASGALFRQVSDSLLADTRALFGGDLEVQTRAPLDAAPLAWLRERAAVSLVVELRTMMMAGDRPQLVELLSVDDAYPLYGEVELEPSLSLAAAVADRDGVWGAALDPVLATRLGLEPGDQVAIGRHQMTVRAFIARQDDRALSADWRGPPVIVSAAALETSGLLVPGSRADYEYRVRLADGDEAQRLSETLVRTFPDADFEVRAFAGREGRMSEVLGQVASGLLLIGFGALFVGGLGVFASVRAWLDSKLAAVATLRAVGLRDARVGAVLVAQVLAVAGSAALVGVVIGGALAAVSASLISTRVPLADAGAALAGPLAAAWGFGVLVALTFALPAIGRALSVQPATLFRGIDAGATRASRNWWLATAVAAAATSALIVVAMPQPLFGLGFMAALLGLLAVLEGLVRLVRGAARRAPRGRGFALGFALASLARTDAPLRASLLSLGTALTVVVASTVVAVGLLETIREALTERAPALVLYDIPSPQAEELRTLAEATPSLERLDLAPLVLGRLTHVNGESLEDSADGGRVLESRDEHKLTHRGNNIDAVTVTRGAWWPAGSQGLPPVAFEDREADQLGLEVGDRLRFAVIGQPLEAELAAIYSQRGVGTRFWFEGIFPDGALAPYISRYVGTAYLPHADAVDLETRIATAMPHVVSVRTERLVQEARATLGRAAAGLAVICAVMLAISLLVLAGVLAASRERQAYDATLLHVLGARIATVRAGIAFEYALIGLLAASVATAAGLTIAFALLRLRLELDPALLDLAPWAGVAVAFAVSALSLSLGASALLRRLQLQPAALLRAAG